MLAGEHKKYKNTRMIFFTLSEKDAVCRNNRTMDGVSLEEQEEEEERGKSRGKETQNRERVRVCVCLWMERGECMFVQQTIVLV